MIRIIRCSVLIIIFGLHGNLSAQTEYEITGYFINMPLYQKPSKEFTEIFGYDNNILTNISRLRIRPTLYFTNDIWLNTEYEINSLLFNSAGLFNLLEITNSRRQLIDLSWNLSSGNQLIINHFIDRLYLKYNFEFGDITIGRQRIAWGTGRVWNPTDLFNPINPANFAKTEKDGVDAISFKWNSGNFTDINFVFNPSKKISNSNYGFRFRTNYNEYDFSIVSGNFDDSYIIGCDFAGNLYDAGIRGEGIYSFEDNNSDGYLKYILGLDYQFTPQFYSAIEYHYNGKGKEGIFNYELNELLNGKILNLGKHYFYLGSSYLLSPLFTLTFSNIFNINDSSGYVILSGNYSLSDNIDASIGLQKTYGNKFSEYWYYPVSYYLKCEMFF